ncbi:MAG: Rha family transcriptional regulator, partial [Thiothrix sp.]|nr:Rha family transcriptional regulator [Thiothrix sp.]
MSQQTTLTISVTRNDTHNADTEAFAPELTVIDGVAFCTSLQVAEHFEKRHADVLRDIEATIAQVLETSNKRKSAFNENDLFQKADYEITTGIGAKVKKPMYLLTRDGFTLLAMGYTGAKAMRFKLAYMEAFNGMEQTLKQVTK